MVFQKPTAQVEKDGWWIAPPSLEVLGQRKYLPPKYFQGSCNCLNVRKEETVALAVALHSCTVQMGMPPRVLCGVVQEIQQCLAPLIEEDCLLNLEVFDAVKRTPWPLLLHVLPSLLLQILRMNRSYLHPRSPVFLSQRRLPVWRED